MPPATRSPVTPISPESLSFARALLALRFLRAGRNSLAVRLRNLFFGRDRLGESSFRRSFWRGHWLYFLTFRIPATRRLFARPAVRSGSLTATARTSVPVPTFAHRRLLVYRIDVVVFFKEVRNVQKCVTFQT